MRFLRPATADEMVATFLRAEIRSSRFSSCVLDALAAKGLDPRIVQEPDLGSPQENWLRGEVLAACRGYGRNTDIFERFPEDVRWVWATIDNDDIDRIRYVDYGYWNRLSGGTQRAVDGARNVRLGVAPYGVSNQPFFDVADRIREGERLAPPILVGSDTAGELVILEGHLRMTSYLLHEDRFPRPIEALVGISPAMHRWVGVRSPHISPEDRILAAVSPTAS